jgi:GntR family transcriptional regulator, rspAB operon transcriptional repressor
MNTTQSPEENLERTRLSDSVYESLLQAILSGRLAPGTPVSEVALARELDVSRTPVHDALRQLATDGLVEQRANHRAVIARFSAADVHDIFEMRKLLEAESARRAAARIDRHTLSRLRATADSLRRTREDPDFLTRWADFDEDFHEAIAHSSGSPRLCQDIVRYRLLHRGFNKMVTNAECLQQAIEEHLRILDALEHRDGEQAARAMVTHVAEWQAYFTNHFPR